MAEPQIVLPDEQDIQISLPDDDQIDLPNEDIVDKEIVDNLPDTLKFAVWDTGIEIPEEVSAGLVGWGDMMMDTYHGVKQILGIDEERLANDQAIMNDLYESDLGGYAIAGAVGGALTEPLGFLIPAGKAGSIGKAAAKGAAVGAGFGATGYVDESKGQTRLGNTAIGAGLGAGISGGIRTVGKGIEARKLKNANKIIDDVEKRWSEKMVQGEDPAQITKELKKEIPNISESLRDATQATGRKANLPMTQAEAVDSVRFFNEFTKQNDLSVGADKVAGIVSTRIKNMSDAIFGRLRRYDRNVMQRTHNYLADANEFLQDYSKKIKGDDKRIIDKALLNGDTDTAERIIKRHGGEKLLNEYRKITRMLDDLGDQLQESGRITNKLEDYYPRYVKDKDGLFKSIGKIEKSRAEEALDKARHKYGKLSALQESEIINKAIRGYPIKEGKPGFAKRRGIQKLTDDQMQYYASPEEALHSYIRNAVTDLEKAKFFGKDLKFKEISGVREFDIDESVGEAVLQEMKKGLIGRNELTELEHLLGVRFGIGEKAPAKLTQHTKNAMYSMLLGNPVSAATQIGDIGVAMYLNGFRNTLKALPKALIGRSKINATDFGLIDNMAEEFATTTKSAKFLREAFKWSGFKSVDKLGKEAVLNGALTKYQKLSKSVKGRKHIADKYQKVFGDEYDKLVDDLQGNRITENVKFMLFNELADVQPISLSEVPEMYLRLPNGRITYMLKTFMLKQFDILRRDAYQKIKSGKKAEGLKNLMKYGLVVGSTNTAAQYIKDWMLGKEVEPNMPADIGTNLVKTFGWSEYMTNKAKKKPVEAMQDIVLPPFLMFDKIYQGIAEDDAAAMQYMPIAGKMWYYWFGGGLEKFEQREEERERQKLFEE